MDMQANGLALGWGRAPDGRLAIGVNAGPTPLYVFLLDHNEEQSLRAALNGIVIPTSTTGKTKAKLNGVEV